jgi:D-alanyl-lipoteichoic acid acyltransferase DltB (MBOAT superfamily)
MYLPIYMSLRKRTPQPLAMSAASMLSFFVMGIWHDNTVMMAVFGLFHGAGVVAVNLYELLLKRWLTREQVKRYRQSRLAHVCAVALCQAYVVTAFLFFAYDWNQLSEVQRCLGRLFR